MALFNTIFAHHYSDGLFFKFYTGAAHEWFNNNGAAVFYEIFWCVFVFLFWSSPKVAGQIPVWVFAIASRLEFLQLWHPPILEHRSTFLKRTLIGSTFSWWDFPHYVLGCALGWLWVRQIVAIAPEVIPFSFIGATFEVLKLFAGKGFVIQNLKSKIQNGMTSKK